MIKIITEQKFQTVSVHYDVEYVKTNGIFGKSRFIQEGEERMYKTFEIWEYLFNLIPLRCSFYCIYVVPFKEGAGGYVEKQDSEQGRKLLKYKNKTDYYEPLLKF